MATALALLALGIVVLVIAGSRLPKPPARHHEQPRPRPQPTLQPTLQPRPQPAAPAPEPDVIGGWLLGHQVGRGHAGFPGDPLPDGHLGSPADLAFWGTVFDEEDD
jgi:hypothetical protein